MENDLINLNIDKSPTRINPLGTSSAIGLTFVSPPSASVSEWTVESNNLGSGHCPVVTHIRRQLLVDNITLPRKWKLHEADWGQYTSQANKLPWENYEDSNLQTHCDNITRAIIDLATDNVPRTSGKLVTNKVTPWWNKDCEVAIKVRDTALKNFKKRPNYINRDIYNKLRNKAIKTLNNAKTLSWRSFCATLKNIFPNSIIKLI